MSENIKQKITAKKIMTGWIFFFIMSVLLELYLESKHFVDSIGLWYTLYVALIFSILALGIVMFLYFIFKKLFLKKRNRKRGRFY